MTTVSTTWIGSQIVICIKNKMAELGYIHDIQIKLPKIFREPLGKSIRQIQLNVKLLLINIFSYKDLVALIKSERSLFQ